MLKQSLGLRKRSRTSRRQLSARTLSLLLLSSIFVHTAQALQAPTDRPPKEWASAAATNEIAMLQRSDHYLRYRMHLVDQKGDQTRDVIESKDGTVARLILRDGRPLTAEEDAAERERLNDMITSPERYARHVKNDTAGRKTAADLIRQMPDAMIFTYVPAQPQIEHASGQQVVLDYSPDPKWSPSSTLAEALTGLQGRMWLDVKTQSMVRMEGQIFKPVNFGWGMLARIYPGGNLLLEQSNVEGRRWIYTRFTQDISVRALMVKALKVHTNIDTSAFQILPGPLSYQDAIKLLLATPLPTQ